jgi:hypothetical protein
VGAKGIVGVKVQNRTYALSIMNNDGETKVQAIDHSAANNSVCCDTSNAKRKRNEEITNLNDSSSIDNLANIDTSTYNAWVNCQSQALPSVFVADLTENAVKMNLTLHKDPFTL